jgi:hypothetical protein
VPSIRTRFVFLTDRATVHLSLRKTCSVRHDPRRCIPTTPTAFITAGGESRTCRKSVVQGSSVVRTQTKLMEVLLNDGIAVLRTSNGRNLSLLGYTNTLLRSQQMSAYNTGVRLQMLAAGRRFAIFPTITPDIDGDDVCNEWERKKYIDLKRDPIPPLSTHPNCRHNLIPVSFAQLKGLVACFTASKRIVRKGFS